MYSTKVVLFQYSITKTGLNFKYYFLLWKVWDCVKELGVDLPKVMLVVNLMVVEYIICIIKGAGGYIPGLHPATTEHSGETSHTSVSGMV